MKLRVRGGWVIGWVDGNGCACRARVAGGIKHLPVRRSRIFPTSVSFFPAGFASSASSCGCSACATAAIPRKANIILTTAIVKCVCICGQRQVSNGSRNYSSRSITADAQTRRETASAQFRRTTGGAAGGGGGGDTDNVQDGQGATSTRKVTRLRSGAGGAFRMRVGTHGIETSGDTCGRTAQ